MSLDKHYNKIKFSDGLRALLSEYYGHAEEESAEITALKHKISGYIEAGLILNILSKDELQDLIDQEHLAAFGMTRKQRRIEKKLGEKEEVPDWSNFDRPAIERKR
jgi:hypothetical protein